MKSIQGIYKIGFGPSSSHAMGPAKAAELFKERLVRDNSRVQVELLGSLSLTGKGHLTDKAILRGFGNLKVEIIFNDNCIDLYHPNTLIFRELSDVNELIQEWEVYSIGGGEISDKQGVISQEDNENLFAEYNSFIQIRKECEQNNQNLEDFIINLEGESLYEDLAESWNVMKSSIERGLAVEDEYLPGKLRLKRKAKGIYDFAGKSVGLQRDFALIHAYALAVSEENANGNTIVTAPTCGSCGVLPAILYYFNQNLNYDENSILNALAISGMFGRLIEENASISGAEVGCQGEIGSACSMAAAAAAYLQRGTISQIEYAAEMGLEHFLGLTCDPIFGLVQIPCIERNALAAVRAYECSVYVLSTKIINKISFDDIVKVMYETGKDMQSAYKETSIGGLAKYYNQ